MLKVKIFEKHCYVRLTNSNSEALILNPEEVIGILDLWSLGYYKIK